MNPNTRTASVFATGVLAVLACGGLAGCPSMRFHRTPNAPGIIDVATPPAYQHAPAGSAGRSSLPVPKVPRDPGERLDALTIGAYGGGGGRFGRPAGEQGTAVFGVELSLNRGDSKFSHPRDAFFVYPLDGFGASLGWDAIQSGGGEVDTGPVYVEAHRFFAFMGAGLGYAIDIGDIGDGAHGPQATIWLGFLQVRTRYLIGGGFELVATGQVKLPFVWITSR
jgi:hypothetical protein